MTSHMSHSLVADPDNDFSDFPVRQANLQSILQVDHTVRFDKIVHLNVDLAQKHLFIWKLLNWTACPNEHHQSALTSEATGVKGGMKAWETTLWPSCFDDSLGVEDHSGLD